MDRGQEEEEEEEEGHPLMVWVGIPRSKLPRDVPNPLDTCGIDTQDRTLSTNAVKYLQCGRTFRSEFGRARQREKRQTRKNGYKRAL